MSSKYEISLSSIWTNLNQTWSCLRTQDFGESIIPQTKATFWLFSLPAPSEYHLPLLAEKNPLADEGFTQGAVLQSIPVGWGSRAKASTGAAESGAGYRSSLPGLLLLESPFPEIPGDLRHRSFKKCA